MRFGTRAQFFVPFVAVLAVMVLVIGVIIWETIRSESGELHSRLNDMVATIDRAHFPLTDAVLNQMKGLTGAEFCLFLPQQPAISTMANIPNEHVVEQVASSRRGDELGQPIDVNGTEYFVRIHHRSAGARNQEGALLILYPVSRWNESVSAAVRPVWLFGIVGLTIAIALTLLLGNRFVNRIRDLELQTRRIAAGDFQPLPLPERNDELRDLAASVNQMAEQLQSMQESLREAERWRVLGQMSGGLAHQLRNGVTGAKLALQLLERESSTTLDEPIRVAQRQLTLIEMQLQRFLQLGRQPHEPNEAIQLADIVRDAVDLVHPRCRHLGIQLQVDVAEQLPDLVAERSQILQLLINLLDNAVDAAGPEGQVELRVAIVEHRFVITVTDTGTGPPAAIADEIFDPFVTGKPNGIGLGLSVVRKVVDSLHGRATWDRFHNRTRFRVLIPASATTTPQTTPARDCCLT